MKICINCKWAKLPPPANGEPNTMWTKCQHPKAQRFDPVDGSAFAVLAHSAREAGAKCGPSGKLWEKRKGVTA